MFILELFSYLLILSIWSCGEDFSGGNRFGEPSQRAEAVAPEPSTFSTRLNTNLAIQGMKCRGNETTEAFGRGSNCLAGQYLIAIDDVNTCTTPGNCTDLVVIPVVAELQDIEANIPNVSVFELIPRSPATGPQTEILRSVFVRSDLNGNGQVSLR